MLLYLATEKVMLAAGGKEALGKQLKDVLGISLPHLYPPNTTDEMRTHLAL